MIAWAGATLPSWVERHPGDWWLAWGQVYELAWELTRNVSGGEPFGEGWREVVVLDRQVRLPETPRRWLGLMTPWDFAASEREPELLRDMLAQWKAAQRARTDVALSARWR